MVIPHPKPQTHPSNPNRVTPSPLKTSQNVKLISCPIWISPFHNKKRTKKVWGREKKKKEGSSREHMKRELPSLENWISSPFLAELHRRWREHHLLSLSFYAEANKCFCFRALEKVENLIYHLHMDWVAGPWVRLKWFWDRTCLGPGSKIWI